MKKTFVFMLVVISVLCSQFSFAFSQISESTTIQANTTVPHLGEIYESNGVESQDMLTSNNDYKSNSRLRKSVIKIYDDKIVYNGNVDGVNFEISGKVYQSKLNGNKIIVDASDNTKNFNVIHNSIIVKKTPEIKFLLSESNNLTQNIFVLYLERGGRYYHFELELLQSEVEALTNVNINTISEDVMILDHWWIKAYEPIVENVNKISSIRSSFPNRLSETKRFRYPDTNYNYEMDLIVELSVSDMNSKFSRGSAVVYIDDQRNYYGNQLVDDVPMLGVVNTKIDITLDSRNGDVFRSFGWGTQTNYPKPKFSIGFGYGIGPFSLSYNASSDVSFGYSQIPSTSSQKFKFVSVNNGTPTKHVSDNHSMSFEIEEMSKYIGERFITADITYNIFMLNSKTIINNGSHTLRCAYR